MTNFRIGTLAGRRQGVNYCDIVAQLKMVNLVSSSWHVLCLTKNGNGELDEPSYGSWGNLWYPPHVKINGGQQKNIR